MQIGVTHDAGSGPNEECLAAARALSTLGSVHLIPADEALPRRLRDEPPTIVFNLARGAAAPEHRARVAAFLEFYGVPYSGSDATTHATCVERPRMKEALAAHGVPTAWFAMIGSLELLAPFRQRTYPVAVRRARGVSSCFATLVAHDFDELEAIVAELLAASPEPVLIERFLPGESFACGILGNGTDVVMLPLVSVPNDPFAAYSFGAREHPARISDGLAESIEGVALRAFEALGCRDLARIDIRLNDAGVPNVCAVDPLPSLSPNDTAGLLPAARAAGLESEELVQRCLLLAAKRVGLSVPRAPALANLPRRTPPWGLRVRSGGD